MTGFESIMKCDSVGAGKEFVELGGVWKVAHIEAAHFGEDRVSVEEFDKARNRFELFEVFDDEGAQHGMARITGTTDATVGVAHSGKIKRFK